MTQFKKATKTKTAIEEIRKQREKELLKELSKIKAIGKSKEELKQLAIFLTIFVGAVTGRIALQWIPSVEPIIPLAIIAGILWGEKEGATIGGGAYIVSNFFVWGLQGPWTIFQALGAGIPGILGGIFAKFKKPTTKDLIILTLIGTAFYELIVTLSGAFMGIGLLPFIGLIGLPLYFLTSLPFIATHIITNAVFARVFAPLLKLRRKKNEFKIISINKLSPNGQCTNIRLYKSSD